MFTLLGFHQHPTTAMTIPTLHHCSAAGVRSTISSSVSPSLSRSPSRWFGYCLLVWPISRAVSCSIRGLSFEIHTSTRRCKDGVWWLGLIEAVLVDHLLPFLPNDSLLIRSGLMMFCFSGGLVIVLRLVGQLLWNGVMCGRWGGVNKVSECGSMVG